MHVTVAAGIDDESCWWGVHRRRRRLLQHRPFKPVHVSIRCNVGAIRRGALWSAALEVRPTAVALHAARCRFVSHGATVAIPVRDLVWPAPHAVASAAPLLNFGYGASAARMSASGSVVAGTTADSANHLPSRAGLHRWG